MCRFVLLLSALLLIPLGAQAKPEPPEAFLELFEQLHGFESAFERQDWTAADERLAEVNETFHALHARLTEDAPEATDRFEEVLAEFSAAVGIHSISRSNGSYIKLQKLVLDIADAYEFPRHPVLMLIDSYLVEAIEALEKREMVEVMLEVDEIHGLFPKARQIFRQHQADEAQIIEVGEVLVKLQNALQLQGPESVEALLHELRLRFSRLVWQIGSAGQVSH